MLRKRWADAADLNRCILRSRRRTTWWEFSARLFCAPCQGALFSPGKVRAGKLSLQPEALGADQEATNGLKHSEKRPLVEVSGPCGPQRE